MSRVSSQPAPPQFQEHAPAASLPLEADPSGFTERAPAMVSLLPDEALSLALARADAFSVHSALSARFAREPAGLARDTLRELLANRALFVMADRPPSLRSFLGCGTRFIGLPPLDEQETPFIANRAFCLLGLPIWSLGDHLIRRNGDEQLEVLGRVAGPSRLTRASRRTTALVLGGLGLAAFGVTVPPFITRDVQIFNGLSRPVVVHVDDRTYTLPSGGRVRDSFFRLGKPYRVEAMWPGQKQPFEDFSLEAKQHAVYNILGAASLQVENVEKGTGPSLLDGRTAFLEDEHQLRWQGDWQQRLLDYEKAQRWQELTELARSFLLADPTQLQPIVMAADILVRNQSSQAFILAQELAAMPPERLAIQRIAQDLFLALGKREEAYALYSASARQVPTSEQRAILEARVAPPSEQRALYEHLLERFPHSPEVMRIVARLRFSTGDSSEALRLLDQARYNSVESLEDVELRVRALVADTSLIPAAPDAVLEFTKKPESRSWEFALLAARLARVVGPKTLESTARAVLPPSVTTAPERMALFELLSGKSALSQQQLTAIHDRAAYDAIVLTEMAVNNLDKALQQARLASDTVVRNLDVETAALLGLELSRLQDAKAAERLLTSSLALMAAREPLESYALSGERGAAFLMLPPGLQAAAYVVRARAVEENRFVELAHARWIDGLGGMARHALDPDYNERPFYQAVRVPGWRPPLPP
ncbi:hypothetical protein [Hyalangium versicolor]|uniref:hypothetical protein n=1 Tax=Hyalangium versicolor TaxID=2861190 RepID=UPI001CCB09E9|nr:hypothetical protein [Hyalangium versicolor]